MVNLTLSSTIIFTSSVLYKYAGNSIVANFIIFSSADGATGEVDDWPNITTIFPWLSNATISVLGK